MTLKIEEAIQKLIAEAKTPNVNAAKEELIKAIREYGEQEFIKALELVKEIGELP